MLLNISTSETRAPKLIRRYSGESRAPVVVRLCVFLDGPDRQAVRIQAGVGVVTPAKVLGKSNGALPGVVANRGAWDRAVVASARVVSTDVIVRARAGETNHHVTVVIHSQRGYVIEFWIRSGDIVNSVVLCDADAWRGLNLEPLDARSVRWTCTSWGIVIIPGAVDPNLVARPKVLCPSDLAHHRGKEFAVRPGQIYPGSRAELRGCYGAV